MYGVFWTTPPQQPAAMVASASVSRMSRVRYSSPATIADSVLSMPPTTVASANGTASGRYGSSASSASSQASVGTGSASPSEPSARPGPGAAPVTALSAQRAQKIALPASTAASAPGTPPGRRRPPTSATSTTVSET